MQRTLLVTHSNQALNQLFEKIMALDIDERHLLRLGHGEEELQTEKDFSRSASSCLEAIYSCSIQQAEHDSVSSVPHHPCMYIL